MKLKYILGFIFFSSTLFSQIEDYSLLNKVLNQLKLNKSQINLNLATDKILPFSRDKTFIVIPKYSVKENIQRFYVYDIYLIIADNKNGNILNTFYESKLLVSDAMVLSNIQIDTGLYNLNENTRAIGIRVDYLGSSKANPYSQTDLSLFIPEKNKLKRVLKKIPINQYSGEWDTRCAGEFETITSYVNIGKSKSNGFSDLIIKSKVTYKENIFVNNHCVDNIKNSQMIETLKFNSSTYEYEIFKKEIKNY